MSQPKPTSPRPRTAPKRRIPSIHPWEPFRFTKADVVAIRDLAAGKANDTQQKRLADLILEVSGLRDLEFRPGAEEGRRASDFASGKRFVGVQWAKALTMPADVFDRLD